jgi:hypothetical protein
MHARHRVLFFSPALALGLLSGVLRADQQPEIAGGGNSAIPQGPPPRVACYAIRSDDGHYFGYYVGGGKACRGQPRCINEGTWGWDYAGLVLPQRVFLQWSHGRCYKGGVGAYKIDGPQPLKKIVEKAHQHESH